MYRHKSHSIPGHPTLPGRHLPGHRGRVGRRERSRLRRLRRLRAAKGAAVAAAAAAAAGERMAGDSPPGGREG